MINRRRLDLGPDYRKKRAHPESVLQEAVVEYLAILEAQGKLTYFSVPNESKRSYALATDAYLRAITALKEDSAAAAALRAHAEMVYAKLTLHRRLDDASAAIANGDAARARTALEEAHTVASRVGEQPTTLIKEATAAYRDLMRRLNRLEIEHAARY